MSILLCVFVITKHRTMKSRTDINIVQARELNLTTTTSRYLSLGLCFCLFCDNRCKILNSLSKHLLELREFTSHFFNFGSLVYNLFTIIFVGYLIKLFKNTIHIISSILDFTLKYCFVLLVCLYNWIDFFFFHSFQLCLMHICKSRFFLINRCLSFFLKFFHLNFVNFRVYVTSLQGFI